MKQLFVSDLDGTLLNAESVISPRSRLLLNEAIAAGTLFTIATARTPATVAALLEGVNLNLDAIVMTGAARWNRTTGKYSHVKYFPEHTARALVELLIEKRFPAFIYTLRDDMIRIYRAGPMTPPEKEFIEWREHTPFKRVMFDTSESGDLWQMPEPDFTSVVLFYSLQPVAQLEEFYPAIEAVAPGVNALHYVDHDLPDTAYGTLEIFAPHASKAAAVREMAAELGVDETIVFGDNVNDLSMMAAATRGVATANAIEQVRRLASEVIGPNTHDAVAQYISLHSGTRS